MDEFLDVEAKPSDGGNSDDAGGDDDSGAGDVSTVIRGDDAPIQNPSPKCRRTSRGDPT